MNALENIELDEKEEALTKLLEVDISSIGPAGIDPSGVTHPVCDDCLYKHADGRYGTLYLVFYPEEAYKRATEYFEEDPEISDEFIKARIDEEGLAYFLFTDDGKEHKVGDFLIYKPEYQPGY